MIQGDKQLNLLRKIPAVDLTRDGFLSIYLTNNLLVSFYSYFENADYMNKTSLRIIDYKY